VEDRTLRPGVARAHTDAKIVRIALRVVDADVPIAVFVEDACVEKLVLHVEPAPAPVLLDQVFVWEGSLRIHILPAEPGRGGGGVDVPPVLLGVLAVVALDAGEAEYALLQDGVDAVPERKGQAETLLLVADAGEAVLSPAVCSRARLDVG